MAAGLNETAQVPYVNGKRGVGRKSGCRKLENGSCMIQTLLGSRKYLLILKRSLYGR